MLGIFASFRNMALAASVVTAMSAGAYAWWLGVRLDHAQADLATAQQSLEAYEAQASQRQAADHAASLARQRAATRRQAVETDRVAVVNSADPIREALRRMRAK